MAGTVVAERPADDGGNGADPFIAGPIGGAPHLRYSNFDSRLFELGPGASAEQAKRALEAHLAETERRMEEAGKLGTTLVQQRRELTERLKEVEQLQAEGELTPELRQKLAEIEKDYNEVARESARAFLPKQRVPSNELASGSPFAPEGKGGRRSVSPSKFESQAIGSPTKFAVPNRKLRNQANRNHDIEFAAEISTSLIAQVRNLQALLAEREEELREVKTEKSHLEIEAEGFQQRVKTLDESEHRYKDENWNLETQIHELLAAQKDAADREKKLNQSLSLLRAEKSTTQRELDEVKLSHSKLAEEHAAAVKHHDIELGTAKRTMVVADSERAALQRKVDDLTGQNQELAKAFSLQRGRAMEREAALGLSDENFETANDNVTPEHSPPPSPVKGTPRHSMLESETLKTSLHHAQRTIQSLRTNVHREKTEKLELKRMLQEARDEVERLRADPSASTNRRGRKVDSREGKKPAGRLGQLGSARSSRNEILLDEDGWDDQPANEEGDSLRSSMLGSPDLRGSAVGMGVIAEVADQFETAHETSDAAFETAHERATETEDFQTGAEDISDDDAATETESPSRGVGRVKRPSALALAQPGSRFSFQSTASTSNDEDDYTLLAGGELKTPTTAVAAAAAAEQQQPQKMRLRVSRGGLVRRARLGSEEPTLQSSPASLGNSSFAGTPQQAGQSLYAELGDFDEGSEGETVGGPMTPGKSSLRSPVLASSPPSLPALMVPRPAMVDSGTMTDVAESVPQSPQSVIAVGRPVSTLAAFLAAESIRPQSRDADLASSRPLSTVSYSDMGAQHDPNMAEKLAQFPSPPTQPVLSMSRFHAQTIDPLAEPVVDEPPTLPDLPASLSLSTLWSEHIQPQISRPELSMSSMTTSKDIPPRSESAPAVPTLGFSSLLAQSLQPVKARDPPPSLPRLSLSSVYSVDSEPVDARSPKRNAFIIPRDAEQAPATPTSSRLGALLGWGRPTSKADTLEIAEDETRQSPSDTRLSETPESQRPLKEVSSNAAGARPVRKATEAAVTSDQGAQTLLTADAIAAMLSAAAAAANGHHQRSQSAGSVVIVGTPSTVRRRRSQDSTHNVVRSPTGAAEIGSDLTPFRRPGSASSARASLQDLPPLPPNHREAIEAARTGSAGGGQGTIAGAMGPPPRPHTPQGSKQPTPASPTSARGTPTPRAIRTGSAVAAAAAAGAMGTAELYTPSRATHRSRRSSVSSFASEIDTRFNMQGDMAMAAAGFGVPNTDPRMIQAITQTMIGEYLWKYTRKAGRGDMSSTRHRRYFWVHPYTRTLYWSERDPSSGAAMGARAELRAKSVPIEAVRVVTDDNPMPPGLHRKSLIVVSPGRTVKFTCTTGQRHETWFNALSYLLLRGHGGAHADAEDTGAGHGITQEDVDEFNPQYGRRTPALGGAAAAYGTARARPPPSLYSYSSRTGRTDSPAVGFGASQHSLRYEPPTLTPTPHTDARRRQQQQQQQQRQQQQQQQKQQQQPTPVRPSFGTLGRLSGYWKDSKLSDTFAGLRSRSRSQSVSGRRGRRNSVYGDDGEDEAHDSAEDLRLMIEQQDRDADRLENVRACCDGRHDVGTLPHSSKRGRHSHAHAHPPGPSSTPTPAGTLSSRA